MIHCAIWKFSKIHHSKKFVNDTFSCKVGAWKFLSRKIPVVVIIVILSRLFPTKGIESMNYFFTCNKILLLWRSHHLWRNKCPAFAVLWSPYKWFCLPFPCFEPCGEITERIVDTSSFGSSGLEFPILMSSGPNVPTASIDGRSHRYLVGWLAQGLFPLLHVDHKVPVTLFPYTASASHNWIPAHVFAPHK